jgi:hypothetical protein
MIRRQTTIITLHESPSRLKSKRSIPPVLDRPATPWFGAFRQFKKNNVLIYQTLIFELRNPA